LGDLLQKFTLVTTIIVLVMMIDTRRWCAPALKGASNWVNLLASPAHWRRLMYLVSAIDFIFIFVSLELVTISFFVLVSFPRRKARPRSKPALNI